LPSTHPALCRLCTAFCPIIATVENGRVIKVAGNPDAPLYGGYTCPKGRALPEQHNGASRLLHSVKRGPDGEFLRIASDGAMDEIAERVKRSIDQHGPRSVAMYFGMGTVPYHTTVPVAAAFQRAIGSRMTFSAGSIDKPGILIALALHGNWQGGQPPVESAGAWIFVGANPIVSKAPGFPAQNPGQFIKEAVSRGTRFIVIDPRRTETARRAWMHLQCRPGEDPAILAGLIRVIVCEGLYDSAFLEENAAGLDALSAAVAPFTPEYVERRAGVPASQLVDCARAFALGRHSGITCGTGPSFATHGTLTEYLALCLATLCGRWSRAGDRVTKPNVLLPPFTAKAQPYPPYKAWGYGEKLRVRGLGSAASGLSAAALADEILLPGEGQVKVLFCVGGNPLMAWPDQVKTRDALKALDLLVTIDFEMTATARLSHYVIAPKLSLEAPGTTQYVETLKYLGTTRGFERPFAAYSPAVASPPVGSDVMEDWEFFYGLAQRMNLKLGMVSTYGSGKHTERDAEIQPLDMVNKPTSDALVEALLRSSRVPLFEVKAHPNGHIFEDVEEYVQPRDPDCGHRLDIGNERMMAYTSAASERAGFPGASEPSGFGSGVPGSRKRLVIG